METAEYIKQLKRLIKKYHPDLCTDEHLDSIYNEITKKLVNKLNELKLNENINNSFYVNNINVKNETVKINEQDYEYYKTGIKYYKNIHPNMFYKRSSNGNYETKTFDVLVSALDNIFLSFNLSEYYFRKVVEEYPQSNWLEDAKEKIKLLNKLYKRYENIVVEENKVTNYNQFINEMGLKII
jgi:hypothetical protein